MFRYSRLPRPLSTPCAPPAPIVHARFFSKSSRSGTVTAWKIFGIPIGKFSYDKESTPAEAGGVDPRHRGAARPRSARRSAGLSAAQLDTPYRDGGWTVRQVVHHLADSHMNAFIRFKLALTESTPADQAVRPEGVGRRSPTCRAMDIEHSLALLEGLHARWSALLSA